MDIYFIASITLNIVCFVCFLASGILRKKNYFLALGLCNIGLVFYHWFTWQYHLSSDLLDAMYFSRLQDLMIVICSPLLIYTFGHWSRFAHTNLLVAWYAGILGSYLILTTAFDLPLRHNGEITLITYSNIFGDRTAILQGELSAYFVALRVMILIGFVAIIGFANKLNKQKRYALSSILIIYMALTMFTTYVSLQVDTLALPLFYIGGLPTTLASVCLLLLIANAVKYNDQKLSSEYQHRIELETALRRLALGSNTQDIDTFYREMLRALYDLSGADFILIGTPNKEAKQINTLCAVANGQVVDNFHYDLSGSPCEKVLDSSVCIYKTNVAELFPSDKMLTDEKIQSYIGLPLLDSKDRPIGIIALLSRRAFDAEPRFIDTLKVFASRTSAEIRRDTTEQKLKAMAYHDYLSKLPNRASLLEEINKAYETCHKLNNNALLLLLDIDNFEHINRKYGNEVGDQVIQQIGQRFVSYACNSIFVARNSGDNFAILLKNADTETMSLVSVHWAAIRSIIAEPCIIGRRQISIACSMGAVSFPEQIDSRFDVISSAEQALREAKLRGRDQFFVFDPQLLAKRDFQRDIESELIKALQENNQLYVVFQPKVTEYGTVIGAETLLRWEHPTRGNIPPSEFIPIAEKSGLIHEIGKWLVVEVCSQMQRWQQHGHILYPISINASSSQFDNPLFVEFLLLSISEYGLANPLIEIELTESGVLGDTAHAVENIQILRDAGISVSLDDFGTGYSSLSYLHILPINVLKIDKSFIDNIHEPQSAELVRSILALSDAMHLKTIAEGTETLAQVEILSKMGCHYFQGYYFSKPLLPDHYQAFCQQANG